VMGMMTDPAHLRVEDPGKVEGNPVFEYLEAFDNDKTGLEELKNHYRKGGLGDVEVKKRLIKVLEDLLSPIRERRQEFAQKPDFLREVLLEGTRKARLVTQKTLDEVREAMKLNYF